VVKDVVSGARCDVAVLRDRGVAERPIRRVLVPVGGGPHARLALRLAWDITRAEGGSLTALRILPDEEEIEMEVEMEVLRQTVEDVLGEDVQKVVCTLKRAPSVVQGILVEATEGEYDLVIIGASEEWFLRTLLFGSIPDQVAEGVPCSVLMVRKYEPPAVSWLRRLVKKTPQRHREPSGKSQEPGSW
jgi:nucleotide-binding universal stress UspA family protein